MPAAARRAACGQRSCPPSSPLLFFSLIMQPPLATLFPYTTLFRSLNRRRRVSLSPDSSTSCPISSCSFGCRSEEHTSELQSLRHLVCRLLLEKKKRSRLILANDAHENTIVDAPEERLAKRVRGVFV